MALSVFDLYSVGIGPSSSHTVGPMRAARLFAEGLLADGLLDRVGRVRAELYGSLGATGHGHGSEKAVLLGLEGADPASVDIASYDERAARIRDTGRLSLAGRRDVALGADDLVALLAVREPVELPLPHPPGRAPHHDDGHREQCPPSAEQEAERRHPSEFRSGP